MRKSALLLVLLFLATQVISQSYKFNRSLILGIGNVRSILQDKEGYLWMAIQDGKPDSVSTMVKRKPLMRMIPGTAIP